MCYAMQNRYMFLSMLLLPVGWCIEPDVPCTSIFSLSAEPSNRSSPTTKRFSVFPNRWTQEEEKSQSYTAPWPEWVAFRGMPDYSIISYLEPLNHYPASRGHTSSQYSCEGQMRMVGMQPYYQWQTHRQSNAQGWTDLAIWSFEGCDR